MAKKIKEEDRNVYYIHTGQVAKNDTEKVKKKREVQERQKRIKQKQETKEKDFDIATETVIQMTNKNKIKKQEERKKKLTYEEKRRKARNKKIKVILKIFVLLGIIVGGITFTMVSPIFNIQDIQVLENEKVSAETIISLSTLKKDENIFRFSSTKISNFIKENAYIENVKIHRKIPNTIQIEVEEREHTYSVDFLGKYAYINKQGYILEIGQDCKEKLILQGIATPEEQVIVGNRLENEDLQKLEDVIKIINVTKEYNLDTKITSIDISDKNEYSMQIEEEKKRVYLGDSSNLSNKMLYVNAILEEEKGKTGEIFANGDLNNKFKVYFRESLI